MVSCSRGSVKNPSTGRCKTCKGFTVEELQRITRKIRGLRVYSSKEKLCKQLLKHFVGQASRSRSRSATISRTRSRAKGSNRSRSRSRTPPRRKRTYKRRTSIRVPHHPTSYRRYHRTPSQLRAPRVTVSYSRGRPIVRTPRSYPKRGVGSLQSRHSKPGRKGPPVSITFKRKKCVLYN